MVNLQAGYKLADNIRLLVDVFNLFDAEDSDIDYYYESRLPGEPVGGVADIHFHPVTATDGPPQSQGDVLGIDREKDGICRPVRLLDHDCALQAGIGGVVMIVKSAAPDGIQIAGLSLLTGVERGQLN